MTTKLTIDEVICLKVSVEFLDKSSQAIFDCFEDREFKQKYYVAVERLKQLCEKLGQTEVTVKA